MVGRVKFGYGNRSVRSSKKRFRPAKIAAAEVKLLNNRVLIVQAVVRNSNRARSGSLFRRVQKTVLGCECEERGNLLHKAWVNPVILFIELEIEEHVWFERSVRI